MDKVPSSQLRDRGFKPHTGLDYDSSYDTSTDFQEADSRAVDINCHILFHNRAKINMVKLIYKNKNMNTGL